MELTEGNLLKELTEGTSLAFITASLYLTSEKCAGFNGLFNAYITQVAKEKKTKQK